MLRPPFIQLLTVPPKPLKIKPKTKKSTWISLFPKTKKKNLNFPSPYYLLNFLDAEKIALTSFPTLKYDRKDRSIFLRSASATRVPPNERWRWRRTRARACEDSVVKIHLSKLNYSSSIKKNKSKKIKKKQIKKN